MSLKIPSIFEVDILNTKLNTPLTLKLYSNNYTPKATDTVANYIEVAGGGYVSKALTFAHWGITSNEPSVAIYDTSQTWIFTDITNTPGQVYGYFIIRNSDNLLMVAERFPSGNVPFAPQTGSKIVVLPRITCASEF